MNDHEQEVTEFSGVAGRVLHQTISGGSFLTGIALGVVVGIGVVALTLAGAYKITTPFVHVIMAIALARIALNGLQGEWQGSVFSSAGGPWSQVAPVAVRYLVLNALWLVPAMMVQPGPGVAPSMGVGGFASGPPMPSGPAMLLWIVFVFGMALAPPVFLIVSVRAQSFGEVFLPDHWKQAFSGRFADLFTVYVIYVGGLVMAAVLSMPVFMGAFVMSWKLGIVVGGATLFFLMGVSINLLGRLCGFFACGDLGFSSASRAVTPGIDDPVLEAEPAPVASAGPRQAPRPVSVPLSPEGVANASSEQAVPVSSAAPGNPVPSTAPPGANPAGVKTALLDAKDRVDRARERYLNDPMGAILSLEELRKDFAPNPQVLHALSLCRQRSGQTDEAVKIANEAIPVCFERGHMFLVAELFKELVPRLKDLSLNRDQLLIVADALVKKDDLSTAAKAYAAIINSSPDETRAVKGLLNVSDVLLHQKSRPDAAAHVYRYLLEHCEGSPLSEFMSRGLEEAERRQTAG